MQGYENHRRALLALAFITLASLILGCQGAATDDHGHEHGQGHAHGGHGGHDDHAAHGPERELRGAIAVTSGLELTVDFPALVAGKTSSFDMHLTQLESYGPSEAEKLSIVLTSQESPGERWEATSARVGVFGASVAPKYPGERELFALLVKSGETVRFSLGKHQVYKTAKEAEAARRESGRELISLSKEEQWALDFATRDIARATLRPSFPVHATIRAADGGEAKVNAPFAGRITPPKEGFPEVGAEVEAGDVLAYVSPSLGASEVSRLRAEEQKAQVELARAERERERIKGLTTQGALPERRLQEAESEASLARIELAQSRARLKQFRNLASKGGDAAGRVAVRSPIKGTITRRQALDGGFTMGGDALFEIIDNASLWLVAHVPEANLASFTKPSGAWFSLDASTTLEVDTLTGDAALVSFSSVIDPVTRTAPLIFTLGPQQPDPRLRAGAFVEAHIWNGPEREALVVPASAILEEKGVDVVYVMVGGERFERRMVRLGARDRDKVEILSGLEPGARVVTDGAYYVKLAGTSTGSVGHGHAH